MTDTSDNPQPHTFLNKLNLIVTIVVALLGGFISVMQLKISSEQQKLSNLVQQRQYELESRLDITDQSAELLTKAKEYLDILNLEEAKKKLVLISLLQLEKELRTSKTGELDAEQKMLEKVNALPYNMALLAGASEALAHIGGTEKDLKLWLPIAKTSGDIEVRKAAIDALRNVGLLTDDYDTLRTCFESIIELTRRWNVPELQEQAQAAITTIAEAYRNVEVDEIAKVNTLISGALRELENLSAVKENLSNGNLIYNSVIVLGDWLKYNNDALDDDLRRDIKQSLQQISKHLDADNYRSWSSTKAKIKEYLTI